jgi:triphosphoribosyl-dephospho-CoA synthase
MRGTHAEDKNAFSTAVAEMAVSSLMEELELTPKPGLVDRQNTGAHKDLTFAIMRASAESLKETFEKIAFVSYGRQPSQSLREEMAAIGRDGEKRMFEVTGGINTHKGAIWSLGLLASAFSMGKGRFAAEEILFTAGKLARYPDRHCPATDTNGKGVMKKFGVKGAKGEAQQGFPHIRQFSLPMLNRSRAIGLTEEKAKLHALLSLIAHLDDTCILHRAGSEGLSFAKKQAAVILESGDFDLLHQMDEAFIQRNLSPGGSADLLAATLFLDKVSKMLPSVNDVTHACQFL